jgi:hypothetical protein
VLLLTPKQILLEKFDIAEGNGLVFTADKKTDNLSEIIALDQAEKFGAIAVYFRRFPNSQTSVPQIYIYDSTSDDYTEIHRKLWSSGVVPFFYIITNTEVKIFSCTKKAEIKKDELVVNPLEVFGLAADLQYSFDYQKYSGKLFDNGTFWEQEQNQLLLDLKNSPYQTLLEGLIKARRHLEKQELGKISNTTVSKLLIMCVLVKYLEEKQDEEGHKLFEVKRDLYNQFPNSNKFTDILKNGQCVPFFEYLADKFNGKIFNLSDGEKTELKNASLTQVARVLTQMLTRKGNT